MTRPRRRGGEDRQTLQCRVQICVRKTKQLIEVHFHQTLATAGGRNDHMTWIDRCMFSRSFTTDPRVHAQWSVDWARPSDEVCEYNSRVCNEGRRSAREHGGHPITSLRSSRSPQSCDSLVRHTAAILATSQGSLRKESLVYHVSQPWPLNADTHLFAPKPNIANTRTPGNRGVSSVSTGVCLNQDTLLH